MTPILDRNPARLVKREPVLCWTRAVAFTFAKLNIFGGIFFKLPPRCY
jgi:hypothetical protein